METYSINIGQTNTPIEVTSLNSTDTCCFHLVLIRNYFNFSLKKSMLLSLRRPGFITGLVDNIHCFKLKTVKTWNIQGFFLIKTDIYQNWHSFLFGNKETCPLFIHKKEPKILQNNVVKHFQNMCGQMTPTKTSQDRNVDWSQHHSYQVFNAALLHTKR